MINFNFFSFKMNPVVFNLKNKLTWLSSNLRWINDDDEILRRLETMNAVNTLLEKTMKNPLLFTMKFRSEDAGWKKHPASVTGPDQTKIKTEKPEISKRWPLPATRVWQMPQQLNKKRRFNVKGKSATVKEERVLNEHRQVAMKVIEKGDTTQWGQTKELPTTLPVSLSRIDDHSSTDFKEALLHPGDEPTMALPPRSECSPTAPAIKVEGAVKMKRQVAMSNIHQQTEKVDTIQWGQTKELQTTVARSLSILDDHLSTDLKGAGISQMDSDNILNSQKLDIMANSSPKNKIDSGQETRCNEVSSQLEDKGITETMYVPGDKVCLVVGRGGRTIIHIQEASRTKLYLESTGDKNRKIRIKGTYEGVEIAKRMIHELIRS